MTSKVHCEELPKQIALIVQLWIHTHLQDQCNKQLVCQIPRGQIKQESAQEHKTVK